MGDKQDVCLLDFVFFLSNSRDLYIYNTYDYQLEEFEEGGLHSRIRVHYSSRI